LEILAIRRMTHQCNWRSLSEIVFRCDRIQNPPAEKTGKLRQSDSLVKIPAKTRKSLTTVPKPDYKSRSGNSMTCDAANSLMRTPSVKAGRMLRLA
jgi:hypothetical protein